MAMVEDSGNCHTRSQEENRPVHSEVVEQEKHIECGLCCIATGHWFIGFSFTEVAHPHNCVCFGSIAIEKAFGDGGDEESDEYEK